MVAMHASLPDPWISSWTTRSVQAASRAHRTTGAAWSAGACARRQKNCCGAWSRKTSRVGTGGPDHARDVGTDLQGPARALVTWSRLSDVRRLAPMLSRLHGGTREKVAMQSACASLTRSTVRSRGWPPIQRAGRHATPALRRTCPRWSTWWSWTASTAISPI